MKGFFVKFWGTRGSIPTPGWQTRKFGGNTPCIEVRVDDAVYICDGGSGLRELGVELVQRSNSPIVAHLFFSHSHWDHIQGFPFFIPVYRPDSSLFVYGTVEGDTRIYQLLSGQMHSDYFPVEFKDLGAKIVPEFLSEQGRVIDGVKVSWFGQVHPGSSLAYRFEHDGCRVVYATDNEIDMTIENQQESEADPSVPRRVSAGYLDFIRHADLLIADGQYSDEEYRTKRGWGHPRATTVVDAAIQAGVKRLAVFHHDPMMGDKSVDELIEVCCKRAEAQRSDIVIFGAREQVEMRLDEPARTHTPETTRIPNFKG
ncbi:MAG: MBL fold metallo-hydrolase [Pseudomonadota bacterium]